MRLITSVAAALVLLSATPVPAQEWIDFVSREDGFKVNFPSAPKVTDTTYMSEYGAMLPARVYQVARDHERYSVTVVDYRGIEKLLTENWFPPLEKAGQALARVVTSGPDEDMEQIEFVTLHAISCAQKSVRVVTPYFLPPDPLTMALGLAAMRGVKVDIVLPDHSNHALLDWARRIPLRPLIEAGCRVWLTAAPFDHSKLMVIDDAWAMVGSANWDTRSFRLNFELNVEVQDEAFNRALTESVPTGRLLTLAEIEGDTFALKLRNNAARLMQPYL